MNICILIGTFNSDVAYRVITESITLIKHHQPHFKFLANKMLEQRIISETQHKETIDLHNGLTANERLQQLINYIKMAIKVEGEVFGIFIDILRDEGTKRSIKLADQLMVRYTNFSSNPSSNS